jgi:hypothetical protein
MPTLPCEFSRPSFIFSFQFRFVVFTAKVSAPLGSAGESNKEPR